MNNIENLKDLIIYQSQNNENISVEVLYDEEDFWLTQKSMSELFGVEVNTINYHLKEIFKSQELQEKSVIRKIRITASDGKKFFILQNANLFLYGIRGYFSQKIKYGKITKYILIIMSQFNRYAKKSKLDRAINTYIIKY